VALFFAIGLLASPAEKPAVNVMLAVTGSLFALGAYLLWPRRRPKNADQIPPSLDKSVTHVQTATSAINTGPIVSQESALTGIPDLPKVVSKETKRIEDGNKRKTDRKIAAVFVIVVIGGIVWALQSNKTTNNSNTVDFGSKKSAHQCAVGTPTSGHVLVNTDDVPLMNGPGLKRGQVLDEKGSEGLSRKIYVTLSPSEDLEAICQSGDWFQVQIVAVNGDTETFWASKIGWVEQRFISRELTSDQQRGLYLNIANNEHVAPEDKEWVRKGALRALTDNKQCKRIDSGHKVAGLVLGIDRTGQYRVTCSDRIEPFNVFFSQSDVVSNKSLALPTPYDESASRKMCEEAIRSKVDHPSTVSIHSIMGYVTKTFVGNGRRRIWQDFTAKNTYGLELTYTAVCLISPDGKLLETSINEQQPAQSAVPTPDTTKTPSEPFYKNLERQAAYDSGFYDSDACVRYTMSTVSNAELRNPDMAKAICSMAKAFARSELSDKPQGRNWIVAPQQ
jgi:hypothetical protein